MADILKDYFSGKLKATVHLLKLRKPENEYQIQALEFQNTVIETILSVTPEHHIQVLKMHYQDNMTWLETAQRIYIDARTARQWRDEFIEQVGEYVTA